MRARGVKLGTNMGTFCSSLLGALRLSQELERRDLEAVPPQRRHELPRALALAGHQLLRNGAKLSRPPLTHALASMLLTTVPLHVVLFLPRICPPSDCGSGGGREQVHPMQGARKRPRGSQLPCLGAAERPP